MWCRYSKVKGIHVIVPALDVSLLCVVGKVYGKVLAKIRQGTEGMICNEQGGFRRGKGYMDQIFAVRQVRKKYLVKSKDAVWAFIDLEKSI